MPVHSISICFFPVHNKYGLLQPYMQGKDGHTRCACTPVPLLGLTSASTWLVYMHVTELHVCKYTTWYSKRFFVITQRWHASHRRFYGCVTMHVYMHLAFKELKKPFEMHATIHWTLDCRQELREVNFRTMHVLRVSWLYPALFVLFFIFIFLNLYCQTGRKLTRCVFRHSVPFFRPFSRPLCKRMQIFLLRLCRVCGDYISSTRGTPPIYCCANYASDLMMAFWY